MLTDQEGGGNTPVEESNSATRHHIVLGSYSVSRAKTRVEVFPLRRQCVRRPSLPLPANSAVEREIARGSPLILDVEPVVSMIHRSFRRIANRRTDASSRVNGSKIR